MIRFANVTKRFGDRTVVRDLTMDLRAGAVTALLGPNGSGKTTTLKMAAGLVRPDAGAILVEGEPAWTTAARRCMSFLPQRVGFPEALTGREVVEFYRRLRGAPAAATDAALRFASLNGSSDRPIATYSGGMAQRLGLAVATLPGPAALLLDEPTAALDPQGLAAFYQLIDQKREGRAILFTSHQVADVARIADRVIVLASGVLIADLSRHALQDWRDQHGVMRLRVRGDRTAIEELRRQQPGLRVEGDEVFVDGRAGARAGVLESVRMAGLTVESLVAEPASLEALYAEILADRTPRGEQP